MRRRPSGWCSAAVPEAARRDAALANAGPGGRPVPWHILPAIAISQFAGTSLWFAINAVLPDLQRAASLPDAAAGWLTAGLQLGFIAGTLVFAVLAIADRFAPARVFLVCSLLGAALAVATAFLPPQLASLLALRFLTGVCLAGIYPVGMKIASGWYAQGLGAALGVLVGALILGTAAPFALRAAGAQWPWQSVMLLVGALAAAGGVLMWLVVPDGPHLGRSGRISPRALAVIWTDRRLRASAFGYFGHMAELYAFYLLLPLVVARRVAEEGAANGWVAAVIAMGAIGCIGGGQLVRRFGGAHIAGVLLLAGAGCGLAAPWLLDAPFAIWAPWLLLWGLAVSGDSPQLSALSAGNAPREWVGSVLTLANCIGFSISAGTVAAFGSAMARVPLTTLLPLLAVGPLLGWLALRPLWREEATAR